MKNNILELIKESANNKNAYESLEKKYINYMNNCNIHQILSKWQKISIFGYIQILI